MIAQISKQAAFDKMFENEQDRLISVLNGHYRVCPVDYGSEYEMGGREKYLQWIIDEWLAMQIPFSVSIFICGDKIHIRCGV